MAFEFGLIFEDFDEPQPLGHLVEQQAWFMGRYEPTGHDIVATTAVEDSLAKIFVIPGDYDEIDVEAGNLPLDKLRENTLVAQVTPDPFSNFFDSFRNREGVEAMLYVSYLNIGSRVLYLADGSTRYIEDPWGIERLG